MADQKVWLITGSSRGLGRAIAQGVLERGDLVVATSRKPSDLDDLTAQFGQQVRAAALDVVKAGDAVRVVDEAMQAFGRLDVVVNNAGYGVMGAFEEQTPEQFAGQMDVNFWGTVNICRAALPVLRKQGSGHLMNVTSIGGRRGVQSLSAYQASKFAVEGFSEVLMHELKAIKVKVTVVEPGGFRTDWAGASMTIAEPMEAYASVIAPFTQYIKSTTGQEDGDPAKAAGVLFQVSRMAEPPFRLVLGKFAKQYVKEGYEASLKELEQWSELSLATEFDDAAK